MTGFAEAVAARVDSEVTAEDELGEVAYVVSYGRG